MPHRGLILLSGALSALTVISAAALLTVISAPEWFGIKTGASQFGPSQNVQNKAPTIFVPSAIHAEASGPLPFFVEIDSPQLVPPDSVLQIRGLPSGASLSEGRRVSADVWAVPIIGLSNLEIEAASDVSQRFDLTLTLIRPDGGIVANARTILSILEPIASGATATADRETTKAQEEHEAADTTKKAAEARRPAEAKAAKEARPLHYYRMPRPPPAPRPSRHPQRHRR